MVLVLVVLGGWLLPGGDGAVIAVPIMPAVACACEGGDDDWYCGSSTKSCFVAESGGMARLVRLILLEDAPAIACILLGVPGLLALFFVDDGEALASTLASASALGWTDFKISV